MANTGTPRSSRHRGWYFDGVNGRIEAYYNGTLVFGSDANDTLLPQNTVLSGTLVVDGASTFTGAQTFTGISTHSDELRVANGKNIRVGTISAFAMTEPTNAIVFKSGTAYAGAITTSGGIQSTDTVLTKIIAAGTVSNIET